MFGISMAEVALIFIIMIIFIRPNDLPKFLRSAGRAYGKARKIYREIIGVKDQVIKEINSIADMADLDEHQSSVTTKKPVPTPAPKNLSVSEQTPAPPPTPLPASVSAEEQEVAAENAGENVNAQEPLNLPENIIKESDDLPRY